MDVHVSTGWEVIEGSSSTSPLIFLPVSRCIQNIHIQKSSNNLSNLPLYLELSFPEMTGIHNISATTNAKFVEIYTSTTMSEATYISTLKGNPNGKSNEFSINLTEYKTKIKQLKLKFVSLKGDINKLTISELLLEFQQTLPVTGTAHTSTLPSITDISSNTPMIDSPGAAIQFLSQFKADIMKYIDTKFSTLDRRLSNLEHELAVIKTEVSHTSKGNEAITEDELEVVVSNDTKMSGDVGDLKQDMKLLLTQLRQIDIPL